MSMISALDTGYLKPLLQPLLIREGQEPSSLGEAYVRTRPRVCLLEVAVCVEGDKERVLS